MAGKMKLIADGISCLSPDERGALHAFMHWMRLEAVTLPYYPSTP